MRTDPDQLSNFRRQRVVPQTFQDITVSTEKIVMSCLTCVYVNDIKKGINLFIDPGYTRETGYTPEILQSMDNTGYSSLVHPGDRKRLDRHMQRLQQAGDDSILEIEYRFRISDGRYIWCRCREAVFSRDADKSVRQIIGSLQDITRWKSTERELRELAQEKERDHEEMEQQVRKRTAQLESTVKKLKKQVGERKTAQSRFRQLSRVFMDAADPIVIEDLDGTIVDLNREAENIYGWKRKELIGKPIENLVPPEEHEKATRLHQRCQDGDEVRHWEGLRQNRNGEVFSVLITAFPLTNGRGRQVALATIAKDISNLKQMETKLKESRKRLQDFSRKSLEALESDRQSVAKEIHDSIGASLAAIKFSLEGVLPDLETNPKDARSKLETTISHLIDTIKETKQISASLRPTTLDDLGLLATIDWYFRRFTERYPGIELIRQIALREEDIPEPHKIVIYRILQEALNNAAKHSRADRVIIRLYRKDSQVQLEIEDTGRGFDVCKALHHEDPFNGHGLANMKERTDLCGGSFLLFSRPGEGTRIAVTLPAIQEMP